MPRLFGAGHSTACLRISLELLCRCQRGAFIYSVFAVLGNGKRAAEGFSVKKHLAKRHVFCRLNETQLRASYKKLRGNLDECTFREGAFVDMETRAFIVSREGFICQDVERHVFEGRTLSDPSCGGGRCDTAAER